MTDIEDLVIRRTLRLPAPEGTPGAGAVAARQFDAALMSVGFKLSDSLFTHLSTLSEGTVIDTAVRVLAIVRRMVGDHVQHNVYFRDFPRNVPDTVEFWTECVLEALADPLAAAQIGGDVLLGSLNLLSLPKYGRYQHSYTEMLAAHAGFIAGAGDRVTVLHAGDTLGVEASRLYRAMAAATTPGNDDDREALLLLARACAFDEDQPTEIPVRENRALINQVRVTMGAPALLGTVTDVLRLACVLCGGDVTLAQPTRFRALGRRLRRALLSGLDGVVRGNPAVLGDVSQYREQWKRLGERLHPHEYPQYPHAAQVFAVARGQQHAQSFAGRVEELVNGRRTVDAAKLLQSAPGQLFRAADRLLRHSATRDDQGTIVDIIAANAASVSGRVLLSLREHLDNRGGATRRVFVNQLARGHITDDTRAPIPDVILDQLKAALDDEIRRRLATTPSRWVIDSGMLDVALPLTGKAVAGGFGALPRGSVSTVEGQLLRFFVYWRQREHRTDFDLSALMLDDAFQMPIWLSYTSLTAAGGRHSGDITEAPHGASEFIDLDLSKIAADIVIPQVNIYSGEGFDEVAESFFGFMLRESDQEGTPFEPRTVRMKSELRGAGRVALPMAFVRPTDRRWRAVWLHLHLSGHPNFNRVENNRATATELVRSLLDHRYLTIGYLADLMDAEIGSPAGEQPVTYIGLEDPGELPDGSVVITPVNLGELIPS
ncbi:TerD family protein [Nocardia transvalensis]|uniref:TerD family protein n=1 Tax=Nocardia transvalensis TaxID=37333 RepID=UPI001E4B66D1|nr:TerD family protein [Nocardia transvalensis]